MVVDLKTTLALPLLQGFQEAGYTDMVISPDEALKMPTEQTVLVIVDTHSKDFLECRAVYDRIQNVVVIDHHRKMVNYIDRTVVFFHEPFASSASEMVTELIEYLGEGSIGQLEADALLSGIMLDTKNFVLKTGVRTFEAAAFLRKKGADTVDVYKRQSIPCALKWMEPKQRIPVVIMLSSMRSAYCVKNPMMSR